MRSTEQKYEPSEGTDDLYAGVDRFKRVMSLQPGLELIRYWSGLPHTYQDTRFLAPTIFGKFVLCFKADIRALLQRYDITCDLNNEGNPERMFNLCFGKQRETLTMFPIVNSNQAFTAFTSISHDKIDREVGDKLNMPSTFSKSDFRSLQDIWQVALRSRRLIKI